LSNGQTYNFTPGVYEDIQINSGATANFASGIYVLSPTKPSQGLGINGAANVNGDPNGVLFYLTGSDYLGSGQTPGQYDTQDGAVDIDMSTMTLPTAPDPGFNGVKWASANLNVGNGTLNLVGIQDTTSPYKNMLFFQRRRNETPFSLSGNAGPNV